jgi:DNA-binding response OmpR family regulator
MNQHTVLVVEDDTMVRELVVEVLDAAGYTVFEADCGKRALQLAREHLPSLVLTDYGLPDMSGVDVIGQLRAQEGSRHIPVMLVTGWGQHIVGSDHGANCVLAKPFDITVLVEHVDDLAQHPWTVVA